MMIVGGSGSRHLAVKLSRLMRIDLLDVEVRKFPDGEIYVNFLGDIEGEEVILVQSIAKQPNDLLIEFIFEAKTLRDLGAERVIGVIPYIPYARQDTRFKPGEALSIRIVAEMIEWSGINELYTIDTHLHRLKGLEELFSINVHNLTCMRELARYVIKNFKLNEPIAIAPDEEAKQWVRVFSEEINCPYAVLEKRRISDEEVELSIKDIEVVDRDVIIVDDIISTGGTMAEAVRSMKKLNARKVYAVCAHPILVGDALYRILKAGAEAVIGTDTIESPISYVSVAPLIASAILKRERG